MYSIDRVQGPMDRWLQQLAMSYPLSGTVNIESLSNTGEIINTHRHIFNQVLASRCYLEHHNNSKIHRVYIGICERDLKRLYIKAKEKGLAIQDLEEQYRQVFEEYIEAISILRNKIISKIADDTQISETAFEFAFYEKLTHNIEKPFDMLTVHDIRTLRADASDISRYENYRSCVNMHPDLDGMLPENAICIIDYHMQGNVQKIYVPVPPSFTAGQLLRSIIERICVGLAPIDAICQDIGVRLVDWEGKPVNKNTIMQYVKYPGLVRLQNMGGIFDPKAVLYNLKGKDNGVKGTL